jgi:ribosome-associated translation inhibitor RaiA
MTIDIDGVSDPTLRALLGTKLTATIGNLRPRAVGARVGFADENGPKRGMDIRCGLTVELPRRPPLYAGATGVNHRLAFEAALEILERTLRRERERLRDVKRRPKKYYLAKRLLAADAARGAAKSPSE